MAVDAALVAQRLLSWYGDHSRHFPWRETTDPFTVLLAEVMLQRTQAPQAARIFADFLSRYPTVEAVAEADPGEVEEVLAGLGLRHRARRAIELCRALVERHGGHVPPDAAALDALPGVGPYTAGAVLCFAFGQDAAIVDRNVVRVLTRVFGYTPTAARPHTDRGLWTLAVSLLPPGRSREYNLALLDLAASICTAKHPRHDGCPIADLCHYYRQQRLHERIDR